MLTIGSPPSQEAALVKKPALPRDQAKRSSNLSPVQLLDALCTKITSESVILYFNYLAMHQQATLVLRALYVEFKNQVDVLHGGPIVKTEHTLPHIPRYLFVMMIDEQGAKTIGKEPPKGWADIAKRMEKVMRPFIEREGNAEIRAVRKILE